MPLEKRTPKIGKNVLENLTRSMYDDARIIYREYVQNAADQIDIAEKNQAFPDETMEINIDIHPRERYISIRDNANGIPEAEVAKRLGDVADSQKVQGENKGFRGIGRLGGLAYCRELRFVTSYAGECVQTTMIWDAERLREIFGDRKNHETAENVLKEVIRYEQSPCAEDVHFFQVELLDVNPENDVLLNVSRIRDYLSEVAPVDFDEMFMYAHPIIAFLEQHQDELSHMPTYHIRVDGREIFKKYPTNIYQYINGKEKKVDTIRDIHTDIIRDTNGKAIAWIWFGISAYVGQIREKGNPMRGLRLRQFNIEIGNAKTFSKFFKEERGYGYYMGEIHTNNRDLIPNARRDYFVENHALREFEAAVQTYFDGVLDRLYKDASKYNSSCKKLAEYETAKKEFHEDEEKGFSTPQAREERKKQLKEAETKAETAAEVVERMKKKAEEQKGSAYQQMIEAASKQNEQIHHGNVERAKKELKKLKDKDEKNNQGDDRKPPVPKKKERPKLLVDELTSLTKKERKLVSEIYGIISANMAPDLSKPLIQKIQEALKK